MPHLLDALGNPIKHGRPSPRTGSTGAGIQKFGTQQLKMFDPQQPALGVIEKDVGARSRIFGLFPSLGDQPVYGSTTSTPFSQRYQQLRPATIRTEEQLETSPHAIPIYPEFPDLGDLFGNGNGNGNGEECDLGCLMTFRGCDCGCKDVKPCITCDSAVCAECNAWDLQCEDCRTKDGTCTPPETPPPCDLGCLMTFRGCDCGCKDVKPCTTCDSAVCAECNAYDLQCEDCRKKDGTCTPPETPCGCLPFDIRCEIGCWWDRNKNYVYIIGGVIGLGILLWLLRPLFGIAKNITGN